MKVNSGLRLGVDLGGTKIAAIVLDGHGKEAYSAKEPTPQGDYSATLELIAAIIRQAEAAVGTECSVGVGTPGSPSPVNGAMRNCNSTCLNGEYLQRDLEAIVGRPIRLANDANCFALSEASDGAAAGYETVFGVILGTGIGAGIVRSGTLAQGRNLVAGEWGHNPVPLRSLPGASRACYCGKYDCVETWLSGPGLMRSYVQALGHGSAEQTAMMNVEQLVQRSSEGEPVARKMLQQHCEMLALSLSAVVNILDPDIIVLGGGLGQLEGLSEKLVAVLKAEVFGACFETPIVAPVHGPASGVRGAANLWA